MSRNRRRSEHGLSESVQYAVIWPALMLIMLGIIQVGLWVHGHTVALRAAQAAADVARGTHGTVADASTLAEQLAEAGGLAQITVSVDRRPQEVIVTIDGTAPTMLDLGLGEITEVVRSPIERSTQP